MVKQKSKAPIIILSLLLAAAIVAGTFLGFRPYYYKELYIAPIPTNLGTAQKHSAELIMADFYVSADGSDSAAGTVDHPFATIERAQEAMRMLNKDLRSHIVIAIKAGTYETECFKLTKSDSGTEKCPIIYSAYGDGEVIFSGTSGSAAIEIDGAKHITISNLTVENPQGSAIKINSSNVDISGCTLKNTADCGIEASGKNVSITKCSIYKTGSHAAVISSGAVLDNCIIHDTSLYDSSRPAVLLDGNAAATHNELYNIPACAFYYIGEKNTVEYNYIHNALLQLDSTAAICGVCEAEASESLVRYNCISTLGNGKNSPIGIIPSSGTTVRGNMLINIKGAGISLSSVKNIEISNNLSVNCGEFTANIDSSTAAESNIILSANGKADGLSDNNLVLKLNETDVFIDAPNGDYSIDKENEAVKAIGFNNLPFDSIGNY